MKGVSWIELPDHQAANPVTLFAKERPMGSKKPNRRGFLKGGVAIASLAAGGAQSAKAQPPLAELRAKGTSKEQIAYGDRS